MKNIMLWLNGEWNYLGDLDIQDDEVFLNIEYQFFTNEKKTTKQIQKRSK